MKAAALTEPGRIEVLDVADPECGPGQVVVRMLGVGLCGSDLSVHSGAREVPRTPWVLGHEGVGEIVAVGSGVEGRRVGQRVAIEPNFCCFACEACVKGFTSACARRVIIGINTPGLLSEYFALPAEFAFPVAGHVSLEDLVCAEPLTVARAAIRRSGITSDDSCLVVGTGSQGLFVCASLLAEGIKPFVSEPHEGRRERAQSLGALVADDSTTGLDYVFETSGVPTALAPAVERLAPGGTAVLVGLHTKPLDLSNWTVVYRQLTLIGSLIYDHPGDFAGTVDVLGSGALAPHRVLQDAFPLSETARAFDAVRSSPGKCWIRLAD
jgi:2-desacetyl-2-hydroxyethyl bacteriochlorophyllide A dehydrogenase